MGSKITRKYQKIFSNTGPSGVVGQFGSKKIGSPTYSLNSLTLQALGAWGEGLNGSCINSAPPFIQDINCICYVISQWLFYQFEQGIPELHSAVTYEVGSFVCEKNNIDNSKGIFLSLTGNNLNKGLSGDSYWQMVMGTNNFTNVSGITGTTIDCSYKDLNVYIYTSGSLTFRLPNPNMNLKGRTVFVVVEKDVSGAFNFTFSTPNGSNVNGASTAVYATTAWTGLQVSFVCDGTQWWSICKSL